METQNQIYSLIDSGNGRKLERFGPYLLDRPSAQAVWAPVEDPSLWKGADAYFTREPENVWKRKSSVPEVWYIETAGIRFKISPTDFGHLGIFPEQRPFWEWIRKTVADAKKSDRPQVQVLNLFAYSGGSTLAAAQGGAQVCHLDASKGMVAWARENAVANGLQEAPIRWIIDDAMKFLAREQRRGVRYDGIILDPPSFGRGSKGEIFKLEDQLLELLSACKSVLSEKPLFVLFSCHTPGFSPIVMDHLLRGMMEEYGGSIDVGEMTLTGNGALPLPSGVYARWQRGS